MSASAKPYGLLAQFDTAADIFGAALKVRDAGYRKWDVFTPFPIHGMDEAMGLKKSKVGYFTFVGGFTGFFTGMTMIWFMNKFDYGLVVGGKPLFTPLYAFPVSYELTILLGSFATLFGMLALNQLPNLSGVHVLRGHTVEVSQPDAPVFVQLDGEAAGPIPGRVEIVPDALTLLMPPSYG